MHAERDTVFLFRTPKIYEIVLTTAKRMAGVSTATYMLDCNYLPR
jgi:hypothetical protein